MESNIVPNLYFADECIDIDGIIGGFNFQACWTGGHIAGLALLLRSKDTLLYHSLGI